LVEYGVNDRVYGAVHISKKEEELEHYCINAAFWAESQNCVALNTNINDFKTCLHALAKLATAKGI